jgi:hypothetical protein
MDPEGFWPSEYDHAEDRRDTPEKILVNGLFFMPDNMGGKQRKQGEQG